MSLRRDLRQVYLLQRPNWGVRAGSAPVRENPLVDVLERVMQWISASWAIVTGLFLIFMGCAFLDDPPAELSRKGAVAAVLLFMIWGLIGLMTGLRQI